MKEILSIIFTASLAILHISPLCAENSDYGLCIHTYPHPKEEFTSMTLDNGNFIPTKGKTFKMEFDLKTTTDNIFGTVFRIITDQNLNIDLMYTAGENDLRYPMLVTEDEATILNHEIPINRWIHVTIVLDIHKGKIELCYDLEKLEHSYKGLKDIQAIRIAFGYCPFEEYSLTDVASVSIKDINLYSNGEKIRCWKLGKHNDEICHDELIQSPAVTRNAHWLIDNRISWKKIYAQNFTTSPSIAFDAEKSIFYLTENNKILYAVNTLERTTDSIRIKRGGMVTNYPNNLIWLPREKQLLSYNLDENRYAVFNPRTQTWEGDKALDEDQNFWNNTVTYHASDSSLVSFGGYGHYRYNNKLVISHPFQNKKQTIKVIHEIHPRYTSSSMIVDNTLYVFGGRGCPSGRQELSPQNYYDLYAINLYTLKTRKLWNNETMDGKDFKPSENMIYDAERQCFYLFSTFNGGTLLKSDLHTPDFETMSLPIGIEFREHYLYSNLYHAVEQNKLYVAIHEANEKGKAKVEIYEMDFPPIPVSSFTQEANTEASQSADNLLAVCIGGVLIILSASGWIYYKQRKKNMQKQTNGQFDKKKDTSEITQSAILQSHYDFSRGCVCFFGGFCVISQEREDITVAFTPTLKALLILLILYTGKNKQGIISHKMIQILWFDKTEESAKNNRNVYISKLRGLLAKVGDVKINNTNGSWNIEFGNNCFCDYLEALRLYEQESTKLPQLLELLLRGMMLPNMETEWIDKFKNIFSSTTIDLLSKLLKKEEISDNLKLKISDTLFQHDYINEEALRSKCQILCQQGKKGLAKSIYDNFCKEYENSLGTAYKCSLKQILTQ